MAYCAILSSHTPPSTSSKKGRVKIEIVNYKIVNKSSENGAVQYMDTVKLSMCEDQYNALKKHCTHMLRSKKKHKNMN